MDGQWSKAPFFLANFMTKRSKDIRKRVDIMANFQIAILH